jgi:hypothetical protein
MTIRSVIGVVLITLASVPGCSPPAGGTGPADEPNVGPGGPAGGAAAKNFKPAPAKSEGTGKGLSKSDAGKGKSASLK